jgi:hypothetical protein
VHSKVRLISSLSFLKIFLTLNINKKINVFYNYSLRNRVTCHSARVV